MANEFIARNGLIAQNNSTVSGSLTVTAGITGSIFGSASYATTAATASYANNFTVAGTLTAQTLVVQTITSSTVYSSGSNIFGNSLANTQTFTGSMYQTGSVAAFMGSVGIGTTNPGSKLEVVGIGRFTGAGGRSVVLEGNGAGKIDINGDGATYAVGIAFNSQLGGTTLSGIWDYGSGTTQNWLAVGGTSYNNAAMYILPSGNVGIGTTNPTARLEIPSASSGTTILVGRAVGNSSIKALSDAAGGILALDSAGTGNGLILNHYTSDNIWMVTGGGSVGINTSSPSYKLDVSGSGRFTGGLSLTSENPQLTFTDTTAGEDDMTLSMNGDYLEFLSNALRNIITVHGETSTYTGNVGIGTNVPTQKLEVNGGDALIRTSYIGNISAFGTNYASFSHIARTGSGDYSFISANDGTTYINAKTSSPIRFRIDNTDKVIINSLGNVGINTTSPNNTLQVVGGITATSFTGSFSGSLTAPGSTTQILYNNAGTIAGDSGLIYSGSYVGIGLTNPSAPLDTNGVRLGRNWAVAGRANIRLDSSGSAYPADILFGHTAAANQTSWDGAYWSLSSRADNASNRFYIYRGGGNPSGSGEEVIMALEPNGKVGIGTTSPLTQLQVVGGYISTKDNAAYGGAFLEGGNGISYFGSLGSDDIQLYTGGATKVTIKQSTGNVGIGSTAPGYALDVVGDARARGFIVEGGGAYASGSIYSDGNWGMLFRARQASPVQAQFMWATAGDTELMRISAAGNVGIGTTSPGAKLHVLAGSNSTSMLLDHGSSADRTYFGFDGTGNYIETNGATTAKQRLRLQVYNSSSLAYTQLFIDGGNNVIYTSATANVGIGITNPSSKLHVYSSGATSVNIQSGGGDYAYLQLSTPASGDGYLIKNTATANSTVGKSLYLWNTDGPIQFVPSATIGNAVTISTSGHVGIGSASPSSILNTSGSNQGITHDDVAGKGYIRFRNSGTTLALFGVAGSWEGSTLQDTMIAAETGLNIRFYTNGSATPKMFISSSGDVGIGTTSPGYKLDVNGNARVSGQVVSNTQFNVAGTPTANSGDLVNIRDLSATGANTTFGGVFFNSSPGSDYSIGKLTENNNGFLQIRNGNNGAELLRINSTGVATFSAGVTATSFTGSLLGTATNATSASYAATSSYATNFTVAGTLTAQTLVVQTITSSIVYSSGSNIFGNDLTNTQVFTGSLYQTGSVAAFMGSVGIGTTNPGSKLYVEGGSADWSLPTPGTAVGTIHLDPGVATDNFGNAITFGASDSSAGATAMAGIYVRTDGAYGSKMYFGTTDSYVAGSKIAVTINESQRVGIGTTDPATKLHVYSSGGGMELSPGSTTTLEFIDRANTSATVNTAFYTRLGYFSWNIGSYSEAMRITGGGNVGIGSTSPTEGKLVVNGGVYATSFTGSFSGTIAAPGSNTQVMYNNSGVIAGSSNLTFDGSTLNVTGTLTATVKSFVIDHPTKTDKKLQYGVLEGPEHSVYVRGKLKNTNYIPLPDYWHALVHEDSITVNITAIGRNQEIWVNEVTDRGIYLGYEGDTIEYFYTVFAERKDIDKLVTEFDKEI